MITKSFINGGIQSGNKNIKNSHLYITDLNSKTLRNKASESKFDKSKISKTPPVQQTNRFSFNKSNLKTSKFVLDL